MRTSQLIARAPAGRRRSQTFWLAFLWLCGLGACVVNPVPTPSSAEKTSVTDTAAGADTNQGSADQSADTAAADTTQSDTQMDTKADADVLADVVTDTTGAVECCPLDTPACDCVYTGGTKGPQGCVKICDAAPVGWKKQVDEHGCPFWQTGPQSCMVLPVKCDGNPPTFPAFTKVCSQDADCGFVVHQTDCCGNTLAQGAWIEVISAFKSAETQCRDQYPKCQCAQGPTKAEVGDPPANGEFVVHCVSGQCLTSAAPPK